MQVHLQTILNNPVIGASIGSVVGAAGLLFWSGAALLIALTYQPAPNLTDGRDVSGNLLNKIDTRSISNRNFFGFADVRPEIIVDDLPETKLQLILRGAFTAPNEEHAGAIIEDNQKKAEHYSVGDTLPGDATLTSIHADRIVLERNGLYETLYFPNDNDRSGIGTRVNKSSSSDDSYTVDPEAEARRKAIRERIKKLRGK